MKIVNILALAKEVVREPSKIVEFRPTAGFRPYHRFFVKEAVKHPAKANLHMLRWIIEKWTKEGDVILDPMAGTFSSCLMAALLERDSIGVEYEDKFYKMGLENKRKFEALPTFSQKGRMVILKGDARQLTKVLANHNEEIGTIITSPPYANPRSSKGSLGEDDYDKDRNLENPCGRGSYRGRYSTDPKNIGNLPHGNIDAIITSPPYAHQGSVYKGMLKKVERAFKEGKITKEQLEHFKGRKAYNEEAAEEYGRSKEQIGNLKYGKIDAIITSPPYAESVNTSSDPKKRAERLRKAGYDPEEYQGGIARCLDMDWRYSKDKENIGSKKYGDIDAIVTSPPYEGCEVGKGIRKNRWNKIKDNPNWKGRKEWQTGTPSHYSNDKQNLGNLKGETYLSAMLQVYCECYKVLKPDGLMILITKNFIRKKKIVRLDLDTIKLCRKAGFQFIDRWYRKLTNFSFWVINYYKKYGLRVEYEDILVFQKVKK